MTPIQQRACEEVEKYFVKAEKLYGRTFPRCAIDFTIKGTTAGRAFWMSNEIKFNNELMVQNEKAFFARTIPHEVAHIVAQHRAGLHAKKVGHGQLWRDTMRDLGVSDISRCHNYDVSSVKTGKRIYKFSCGCTIHNVGGKTNNRINAGAQYSCKMCGNPLKAVVAPRAVDVAMPKVQKVVTGSKTDRAREIYRIHKDLGPSKVIAMFMEQLNMSKAGASTYYYNIKKSLES